MTWDEPKDCTTERGWLVADANEHPDGDDAYVSRCVGNYLQYDAERGYHVCAYIFTRSLAGISEQQAIIADSERWYATRTEAKAAVERFAATLLPTAQMTLTALLAVTA